MRCNERAAFEVRSRDVTESSPLEYSLLADFQIYTAQNRSPSVLFNNRDGTVLFEGLRLKILTFQIITIIINLSVKS